MAPTGFLGSLFQTQTLFQEVRWSQTQENNYRDDQTAWQSHNQDKMSSAAAAHSHTACNPYIINGTAKGLIEQ